MMAFFTVRIARGLQTHLDFGVLLYDNSKNPKANVLPGASEGHGSQGVSQ